MKREVPVEQAVGLRLAHDLTQIIPGSFKGVAFAKGYRILESDIPRLLDMGKRHVYVLTVADDELHEDDAAVRMAQSVAGMGIHLTEPHEGKVVMKAAHDGMLWIDAERVLRLNMIDDVSLTTRSRFIAVSSGQSVAAVRPIPLTFASPLMAQFERIAARAVEPSDGLRPAGDHHVVEVWPFLPQRIAVVTTGSEVQSGRVTDRFGPVLRDKFSTFGMEVEIQAVVGDETEDIRRAIRDAIDQGATLVCVTGGMSVDPDDRTPGAIRTVADEVVSHGTPMLPGSMTMVAYAGSVTVFGLPGAVIHDPVTAFDVLLPRALSGWRFTKVDIAGHGVGGWLHG